MDWKRLLAYISGSVDQELLLRNEYLAAENRVLRNQIKGRLQLSDPERIRLAEIGKRLGRKALAEVAQIVRPETILGWHRKLIAKKFDGSKQRTQTAPADSGGDMAALILRLARENRTWGYRRIVGALANLGHDVSHQTVANVLAQNGLPPAPERGKQMSWREFIRSHMEVLVAVDFFTVEVWTRAGLMTYYVLTFMRAASRNICIAGVTLSPDGCWMRQMARNVTMAGVGFLDGCQYLLHDRDAKFCAGFDATFEGVGFKVLRLPPRSPNLNAHLERWNRSIKEECLSKLILFGEQSLRHVLAEYVAHFHRERNHQGRGNLILLPTPDDRIGETNGTLCTRERLGGLLKFYHRAAA